MNKKILSLFLSLISVLTICAQQIPNSDFERFERDALNNGVGERPVGWNTSNIYKSVLGVEAKAVLVAPDNNGRNGKCVRARNAEVGAAGITEISPAWFTLGKPWNFIKGIDTGSATAGTDGGINFTFRPDTMVVWIKRTYDNKENARITFYTWKGTSRGDSYKNKNGGCSSTTHYDEESDIRRQFDGNECGTTTLATQIAEGNWISSEQFKEWTEIKIPIRYLSNEKPEKVNVIISSANYPDYRSSVVQNNSALWADDLKLIYSSAIDEIYLDGRKKLSTKNGVFDYTCSLGKSATSVGEITVKRSGRYLDASEFTVTKGAIGEVTKIVVKAEDGSSTSTYNVTFAAEMSKNPNISNIKIGGISIKGFNPLIYNYDVELPYGTKTCPDVVVEIAEDGQTYVVNKPSSLPGRLQVTSTAPDGMTTKDYIVNLTVGKLTDNTLLDIKVGGKSIHNFLPATNNYTIELPLGTTNVPTIEYVTAYPDDHIIVVDNKGIDGGVSISVTPRGTSLTRVYKLKFIVTESRYSYLSSIKLDGVELPDFSPYVFNYDINLPIGTVGLPAITYVKGDEYQKVIIEEGGMDGTTKIIVVAQSGDQSIYRINFSVKKSSVSTLKDIKLNGISIEGFSSDVTSYTVNLPIGTSVVPDITVEKGDDFQNVTINKAGINAESRIVVIAQDGSVTTYKIKFEVAQSSNTKLKEIFLDGVLLAGFNPVINVYDIVLPRGTVSLPEITWTVGDSQQIVRKSEGGVNGETKITVKAQSGDVMVYILNFSVETNSNVNLNNIFLNDVPLDGFKSDILDYTVELPSGTTSLPTITFEKADMGQTVVVTKGGLNGKTQILVRSEDGNTRIYTISFSVKKSENAFLKMIYVDGDSLDGFQSAKLDYSLVLSSEDNRCPHITVDSEPGQQVSVIVPLVTGVVRIEVTPQSGSKNVYTINVDYPKSKETSLASIKLDGVLLDGFSKDKYNYNVILPVGTKVLPNLTFDKSYKNQTVYFEQGGISEVSRLFVKAENGDVVKYEIAFSVAKSADSLLKNILVDGVSLENFSPEKTNYEYVLSDDRIASPVVSYELNDNAQHVTLISPILDGTAKLIVDSEDKTSSMTYTVEFKLPVSNSVVLDSIILDEPSVNYHRVLTPADFLSSDELTIDWVKGVPAPSVTYAKGYKYQQVAVADAKLNGAEIMVVAQNGDKKSYSIRYNIIKADYALLNDIQLFEKGKFVSLSSFNPEQSDYEVVLPWRSNVVPVINPVKGLFGQTIDIQYGGVNDTTTIKVISEDGNSEKIYNISFSVIESSLSELSALYYIDPVAGQTEIPDFRGDKNEYVVRLPYGTKHVPSLTWDLGRESNGEVVYEQNVEYFAGSLSDSSTVKVIAEDGTCRKYIIRFDVANSTSDNELKNITIGSKLLNIEKEKYDYSVELPYNTKALPEISYTKAYDEQSVLVTSKGILGGTKITVFSNKGDGEKVDYNINYTISNVNPLAIHAISVSENIINVDPEYFDHIINVSEIPTMENVEIVTDAPVWNIVSINAQKAVVKTFDKSQEDSLVYKFYFHYPKDVIPNADFKEWEFTKYNNAVKPSSWMVPADCAESVSAPIAGTYRTGNEVMVFPDSSIKLSTIAHTTPNGSIPGMMTIGSMNMTLATWGNSSSSVGGGVPFHNTPNKILVDYMPVSNSDISNWRMIFTIGGASSMKTNIYSGNFNNKKQWSVAEQLISYPASEVTKMNIVLNSCHTENARDMGGNTYKSSVLYIKNLRLYYENLLSEIRVNGVKIPNFKSTTYDYTYDLPAEQQEIPVVEAIGEVEDQQHRINFSAEVDGKRVATITSVAEDGSSVDYTITFNRTKSNENRLNAIFIDGVALDGFVPEKTEYNCNVTNSYGRIPDVHVDGMNYNQTITYTFEGSSKLLIMVRAENKIKREIYTVNFIDVNKDNSRLKNVTVNGTDFIFDEGTKEYSLSLNENVLPYITFEKYCDGQNVVSDINYKKAIFSVFSQSGKVKEKYVINFVRPEVISTACLSSLSVDDVLIDGFARDKFVYHYNLGSNEIDHVSFVKESFMDNIRQYIYSDSVVVEVYGAKKNKYTVIFDRLISSDSFLSSLTCDGEQVPGFAPSLFDYPLNVKRRHCPDLKAVTNNENSSMSVDYDPLQQTFSFNVVAQDGSSNTTNVQFSRIKSSNNKLEGIWLNGELIKENGSGYTSSSVYNPEVLEYRIKLHSDDPKLSQPVYPALSVMSDDFGQSVNVERDGIDGDTYITVRSESGVENMYKLTFSSELSSCTMLKDIAVDYVSIPGFDPKRRYYELKTDKNDSEFNISYNKTDPYQIVRVNRMDDEIDIEVTAEDGSQDVYGIKILKKMSSSANLQSILKDGEVIEGFDPDIFDYFFDLPVGSQTEPMLSVISGEDGQQISIISGGINGITKINVVAENGMIRRQYRIHYNLLLSENNKLKMIYLNGDSLSRKMSNCFVSNDFSPNIRDYEVILPIGSDLPVVTWQQGDDFQRVELLVREDGTNVVSVIPQREELRYEYIIRFLQQKSYNSYLESIEVDGAPIKNFNSETFNYVVDLPVGTEKVPYISYTAGDKWQNITYKEAETINDVSVIKVEAQDVTYTSSYFIRFNKLLSSVDTLQNIYLNGIVLDGFKSDVFDYSVLLPIGTTEMPFLEWLPGDPYQKIKLINSGLWGGYSIIVEAENGSTNVYNIKFEIQKSDNSLLKSILVNGELMKDFDPEIFDYEIILPYGEKDVPLLMYELSDVAAQSIDYKPAKTLNDTATFSVVAENKIRKSVYRVWFSSAKSDNAFLDNILIAGESISVNAKGFKSDKNFDSNDFIYDIVLPYGTTVFPEITCKGQVEDYFSISISGNSVCGTTIISVTSADERYVNDYVLNFSVRKSNNALLKSLQVSNDLINDFDSEKFEYIIEFPIGTDTISLPKKDDIVYEKSEDSQTVVISNNNDTEFLLLVTAEDGETKSVYSVKFVIKLSSNVLLSDIKIGGVSLVSFSPTQYEYTYYVMPGVDVPEVTVIKSEDSQKVDITIAHVGEPTEIYVEAEDGTVGVYRILFKTSEENPYDAPSLDDVAWTPMGNGSFKASSTRDGVVIMIYKMDGTRVWAEKVDLVDPNDDIRLPHEGGTIINMEKKGQWYIYVFVYKNIVVSSGKFIR